MCKASRSGDAKSMFKLGLCLELGQGVTKDISGAILWWRKAAAVGVEEALYALSRKYLGGSGVPADRKESKKWFVKAEACRGDKERCPPLG